MSSHHICHCCVQVSDFGLSRAAATESAMSTNTFGTVRTFTFVPQLGLQSHVAWSNYSAKDCRACFCNFLSCGVIQSIVETAVRLATIRQNVQCPADPEFRDIFTNIYVSR